MCNCGNCGCKRKFGFRYVIERLRALKAILEAYASFPEPSIGSSTSIGAYNHHSTKLCNATGDELSNIFGGSLSYLFGSNTVDFSVLDTAYASNAKFASPAYCIPTILGCGVGCGSLTTVLSTECSVATLSLSSNWTAVNLAAWATNLQVIIDFYESFV